MAPGKVFSLDGLLSLTQPLLEHFPGRKRRRKEDEEKEGGGGRGGGRRRKRRREKEEEEDDPDIPVAPGEEHYVLDRSLDEDSLP